jgi:DNA-binding NarL/FixJ family response regulator
VLVALCRPLLDPDDGAAAPQSNGEIAAELTVSVEAVRSHMKHLFKLFEVPGLPQNRKRAELARRALAAGVVVPRDVSR